MLLLVVIGCKIFDLRSDVNTPQKENNVTPTPTPESTIAQSDDVDNEGTPDTENDVSLRDEAESEAIAVR